MSRIMIGQYYAADSPIHRLDPRVKLLSVIAFVTILLFANNFWGFGLAAVFLAVVIRLSRVPVLFLFRGLRAVFFILLFAMALNLFLTPGEGVIFSWGFLRLTIEGVHRAGLMAARLLLLVVGSAMLTLTTSPIKLTDGIESLLSSTPLPAHDIAIMMTIALRMIPTLAEETDKIMKAQKARGANFETGGPHKRIASLLPILVPLFVSSFKRADELSTAMEARCYRGGTGRTKMRPLRLSRADAWAGAIMVLFCIIIFFSRFL